MNKLNLKYEQEILLLSEMNLPKLTPPTHRCLLQALQQMVMLNLKYVLILQRIDAQQALFEGLHPRLVRLLLRKQCLPAGVLHYPYPCQSGFLNRNP